MVGVHAGEYTQEAGKPQCFFSKTCPDCNKYLSKSEHVFDEWHYTGPDCTKVHSCIHCNTEESKVEHDYQEQSKDAECKIFKVCSHCKDKQYVKETHAYEGSEQVQCDVFKVCKDCGHKKADGKKHTYQETRDAECKIIKVCEVCADQDKSWFASHEYGEWQNTGHCTQSRSCVHCGKTESLEDHNDEEMGKDEKCRVKKVCRNCGREELSSARHNWVKNPLNGQDFVVNGCKKCKDCQGIFKA
ncbi:hypothetical protein HHE02_05630 [Helicobacter heilmannii]|uniref:hypothetical protein n=1 Tax=Helicobacter heilmannii TaxID=35817 RepID=UPI0006A194F7|nr:hypothetical protein [Helicobacter heilmannii]CRF47275.1 hypothetical protein HHE02_05630 [Helicobacter heilmannii]